MNTKTISISLLTFFLSAYCFGQDVKQSSYALGAGSFQIEGGFGHEEDSVTIHYYKPIDYNKNFKVLIVLPGGGRNGDGYRDKWIDLAEEYNLLILSPSYSEEYYPKVEDYNLGRLSSSSFMTGGQKSSHSRELWILDDFDRIFDIAVHRFGSSEEKYDIFGHSAGGQIAHRLALFNPDTKVNQIVAANSGWYTLADYNTEFPYGLKDVAITEDHLKVSFNSKLIILLGELDNEHETRGHLRTTELANRQGSGRFARGHFFFEKAREQAEEIGSMFLWQKKTVKGVGHSSTKMSLAAAELLYSIEK
jgi:pimeloyl-ACP methyl ester carboxylesterase